MTEERTTVNTPGIMELTLYLEVIRLANHYQLLESQSGGELPRRAAIVRAATDLTHDLDLVRDVFAKARIE